MSRRPVTHRTATDGEVLPPSLLRHPLRLRPHPQARRAVHRPVEPGRERRGVPVRRGVPGAGQGPDDALQAAPRDRRAGDDGVDHHPDAGQAVGLLPRHDPATLGRGPARHDGRGRLRRPRRRLDEGQDHVQLVVPAQHRMHADGAARRAVLHRAGADAEDRQAVRVRDGPGDPGCR